MIAGNLLASEIANRESLKDYFGGEYEIVYWNAGSFHKLDSISYVVWQAALLADGRIGITSTPSNVFIFGYSNDVLVIRSLEMSFGIEGISAKHWYSHIDPIYRTVTPEERGKLTLPNLNSKRICNIFLVQGDPGMFYCDLVCPPTKNRSVSFTMNELKRGGSIKSILDQSYMTSAAERLLRKASKFDLPRWRANGDFMERLS